jgi:hypothetical protein
VSLNDHAPIAPSSAPKIVPCPGSLQMEAAIPAPLEETEAQRVGTAGHWVVSEELTGETINVNTIAPNGEVVTYEMIDGAEMMLNDVNTVLLSHPEVILNLQVETRVDISHIHPDNWGTPDCWVYVPATKTLYLWDYKFGFGYVDVFENWQLIDYCAGILKLLGFNDADYELITVVFAIIQPRFYDRRGPVRKWTVKASELRGYFNKMIASFKEATSPNPRLVTGSWCLNCTAIHRCRAYQLSAASAMDYIDTFNVDNLDDFDLGVAAILLEEAESRVKSLLTGIKSEIETRIRSKKIIAGWMFEKGNSRKKWIVPPGEIIALGELLNVPIAHEPEPLTPTQTLALLKRNKIDDSVIEDFWETTPVYKLIRSDESTALKAFKKVD